MYNLLLLDGICQFVQPLILYECVWFLVCMWISMPYMIFHYYIRQQDWFILRKNVKQEHSRWERTVRVKKNVVNFMWNSCTFRTFWECIRSDSLVFFSTRFTDYICMCKLFIASDYTLLQHSYSLLVVLGTKPMLHPCLMLFENAINCFSSHLCDLVLNVFFCNGLF